MHDIRESLLASAQNAESDTVSQTSWAEAAGLSEEELAHRLRDGQAAANKLLNSVERLLYKMSTKCLYHVSICPLSSFFPVRSFKLMISR